MHYQNLAQSGHLPGGGDLSRELFPGLRWRVNRLRCMTPAEVSHRLLRALCTRAERAGLVGPAMIPAPDLEATPRPWVHASAKVDAARCLAAAKRVAAGKLDVFALHGVELGAPPRWNRDPKTGVEAPLTFGKLLDYRNPALVGDIKYLWEVNRHLHLVTLAQGYSLSGDRKYFNVICDHLDSWFTACPYGVGPNWSSALEAGIRLINWSVTWQLLGGARSRLFEGAERARFRQRWLEAVYRHAQFIEGYFSRYSSANNHIIGEAAGLFIAALTWPHWPQARAWLATAKAILEREAVLQNAPDGVNREQAAAYQEFVLDLLLLCLLAGKANGQWFSAAFELRVEAMAEYLASVMDAAGHVPMIGDSDDHLVGAQGQGGSQMSYRSVLATAAIVFQRSEFKHKARTLDDKTRWLFGSQADALFERIDSTSAQLPPRQAFHYGGYYVLGCDFETEEEIRLVADAGPLGYCSIAAHGHADALAFTLSVGGLEFLIDPGTYAYHTQGDWRGYFRGTLAHNTVRLDGQDQSQSGGNFMWLRKARAGCSFWSSSAERDVFEGWQDGYTHLSDPALHRRRITLEKRTRQILIRDTLSMAGAHEIELLFHCSEHCRVEPSADGYTLSRAGRTLHLKLPQTDGAQTQVYRGSTAPILGWVSPSFDVKVPAPTIVWRAKLAGNTVLSSEIVA